MLFRSERRGSTLWVVRGTDDSSVTQLRLQRRFGGWTARFQARLTDPTLEVPSTATFAGGFLWAVNARFNVPPTPTTPYCCSRRRRHSAVNSSHRKWSASLDRLSGLIDTAASREDSEEQ